MKKWVFLLLIIPELVYGALPNHCRRFQLPGWWGEVDYLLIWRKDRFYPPLATTSPDGTAENDAGVLGLSSTSILFGDKEVNRSPTSGGRGDLGFWMLPCLGFGGGVFVFGEEKINFRKESNQEGSPIIARPFFDIPSGAQSAILVSYPDLLGPGQLKIDTTNQIGGGELYTRYRMLGSQCIKFDLLGGFRYLRLDDDLDIMNNTFTIPDPGEEAMYMEVSDRFHAKNDFYSGLVGFIGEARSQCWAVCVKGKVGIGNMVQKIHINGQTIMDVPGGPTLVLDRGLLAALSNSGRHSRSQFQVIPEINAQLQLRLFSHCWLSAGYQYIFWPKVLLAGEQVDLNIDMTGTTPNPAYVARQKSFWAQGLTLGIHFLY